MIPNIYQSIDEIVRAATPAQKIIWQQIRLLTGENASVRQLYYIGGSAATRFVTYTAGQIFLIYEMVIGTNSYAAQAGTTAVGIYNESNTLVTQYGNEMPVWNATAAALNYVHNPIVLYNLYFGRITTGAYTYISLIGYEINY